ncbi:hypothetical protein CR513_05003, partial [Mucuna pruriens]
MRTTGYSRSDVASELELRWPLCWMANVEESALVHLGIRILKQSRNYFFSAQGEFKTCNQEKVTKSDRALTWVNKSLNPSSVWARKPRVSRPKKSILAQKKRSQPELISAVKITPSNKEQCMIIGRSVSALEVLMAIAKGLSIAIPRIYTIATSSVGRDYGLDSVTPSSTTIAMVDGGGSPLLARTLRIKSSRGAKLTNLAELQVESLFYPCYNLRCKLLQEVTWAHQATSSVWKISGILDLAPSATARHSKLAQWYTTLQSSFEPLHAFDPEIERTLQRLRKARHTVASDSSSSDSIWNSKNSNFTTDKSISVEYQEAGSMENNDRTLKELATPDVVYQPWCIQCPPLEPAQSYELKSSLIHLLPKFHGLAGEDPHKHLKEFHVVCSTMRP